MCGRYTLRRVNLIRAALSAMPVLPFEEFSQRPRFNVAPSQQVPIVRWEEAGAKIDLARWGLIPAWAKDASAGYKMINARSETAAQKPAFRQALASRRCLVPADGFYEWQSVGGKRQPIFVHRRDDGVFCFAGLWERWQPTEAQEPIDSMTILTTTPNRLLEPIHDRMPVILRQEDYRRWLDPATPRDVLKSLLGPYPEGELEAYPVSPMVNNPRNDDPQCVEPNQAK